MYLHEYYKTMINNFDRLYYSVYRDESKQEQLWEISINMIKEFLAPEVLERYGPSQPVQGTDTKTDKNTALETAERADKQNEEN